MITGVNNDFVNYGVLGIKTGRFRGPGCPCNSQNKPGNSQKRGFGNIEDGPR